MNLLNLQLLQQQQLKEQENNRNEYK